MNTNPSVSTPPVPRVPSRAIARNDRMIIKRDGKLVPFDLNRITRAIALAFFEVQSGANHNPYRDDFFAGFGLAPDDFLVVTEIADKVSNALELYYRKGKHPTIEDVQNAAIASIAAAGHFDVAYAYMQYRMKQAERRLNSYDYVGIEQYIETGRYMRWNAKKGRREIWSEAVRRVADMHRTFYQAHLEKRFPKKMPDDVAALFGSHSDVYEELFSDKTLAQVIEDAFEAVNRKEVLPSMRTMQFGGEACLKKHARVYNCAFTNVDRVEVFREFFYLLLCGTGCGFSVQKHHIARLPEFPIRKPVEELEVKHVEVDDTIEGWADAAHSLVESYLKGHLIEFSFAKIRAKGAPLKTSGGKAPGHLPLKKALGQIDQVLAAAGGRKLKSIEIYDILMFLAKAVLSGGIRRSATICLFSADDEDMMTAKTGDWYPKYPHRSASNNSAVIPRSMQDDATFKKLFKATREFGEPGFLFSDDPDAGVNPCAEIGMLPKVNWDLSQEEIQKLWAWGYTGDMPGTTSLSGWSFCNLSSTNGAKIRTIAMLVRAVARAAILGTLQAGYTVMDYLGPITRLINEHDALLGVSICGFMASPDVLLNPNALTDAARCVKGANWLVADLIGIRRAARTTTVKPEGTTASLLGTSAGIHLFHASHYLRFVQAARNDPVYQHFRKTNPQMCSVCESDPAYTDGITFPMKAPQGALLKSDVTALEFLEYVRMVQRYWVKEGTNHADNRAPHVTHNVSNTVSVKKSEWAAVEEYVWQNRADFTALSFLEEDGERRFTQAPFTEVSTEEDIARWNALKPRKVTYTEMHEAGDQTALKAELACAGGACSL